MVLSKYRMNKGLQSWFDCWPEPGRRGSGVWDSLLLLCPWMIRTWPCPIRCGHIKEVTAGEEGRGAAVVTPD